MNPESESPGRVGARTGAGHCGSDAKASTGLGHAHHIEGEPLELSASQIVPRRPAPYANEIERALTAWWEPNVKLYAGDGAWDRAKAMRGAFGPLAAMVLPDEDDPESLRWPALRTVVVLYPDGSPTAYRRKLGIARALVRDGVECAWIEHWPAPLVVRSAGA